MFKCKGRVNRKILQWVLLALSLKSKITQHLYYKVDIDLEPIKEEATNSNSKYQYSSQLCLQKNKDKVRVGE